MKINYTKEKVMGNQSNDFGKMIKGYVDSSTAHKLIDLRKYVYTELYVIDIDPVTENYYPRLMVVSSYDYCSAKQDVRLKYASVDIENTNIMDNYWAADIIDRLWYASETYSLDKVLKLFFIRRNDCKKVIAAIQQ